MEWSEVLEDPCLRDLPYKIELNEYGNIVMSPASNWHAEFQAAICNFLKDLLTSGRIFTECSVATSKNVRVPDVAWGSDEFSENYRGETPFSKAPEICVDVASPGNSFAEMLEKRQLYLEAGAHEFWLCDEEGNLKFFDVVGEIADSRLCPKFPRNVKDND